LGHHVHEEPVVKQFISKDSKRHSYLRNHEEDTDKDADEGIDPKYPSKESKVGGNDRTKLTWNGMKRERKDRQSLDDTLQSTHKDIEKNILSIFLILISHGVS